MDILWGLSLFIALGIFAGALYEGRGFQAAIRLAMGVLVIGMVGTLVVMLLGLAINLAFTLARIGVWVLIVLLLISLAAKVLRR